MRNKVLLTSLFILCAVYWATTEWLKQWQGLLAWTKPPHTRRLVAGVGVLGSGSSGETAKKETNRSFLLLSATPAMAIGASPQFIAEEYLNERKKSWGVQDYHQLRPNVYPSPMGSRVKYSVFQDNIPIVGMEISFDFGADNILREVENGYRPVPRVDLSQPFLNQEEILAKQNGRYQLDAVSTAGVSSMLYLAPGAEEPELAYVIPVKENSPNGSAIQIIFRASDGQILGNQASRSERPAPK